MVGSELARAPSSARSLASKGLLQIRCELSNVKEMAHSGTPTLKFRFFSSGLKVTFNYSLSLRNSVSSSCLSQEWDWKKKSCPIEHGHNFHAGVDKWQKRIGREEGREKARSLSSGLWYKVACGRSERAALLISSWSFSTSHPLQLPLLAFILAHTYSLLKLFWD